MCSSAMCFPCWDRIQSLLPLRDPVLVPFKVYYSIFPLHSAALMANGNPSFEFRPALLFKVASRLFSFRLRYFIKAGNRHMSSGEVGPKLLDRHFSLLTISFLSHTLKDSMALLSGVSLIATFLVEGLRPTNMPCLLIFPVVSWCDLLHLDVKDLLDSLFISVLLAFISTRRNIFLLRFDHNSFPWIGLKMISWGFSSCITSSTFSTASFVIMNLS